MFGRKGLNERIKVHSQAVLLVVTLLWSRIANKECMHGGQAKIFVRVSKLGKICGRKGINDLSIHKV